MISITLDWKELKGTSTLSRFPLPKSILKLTNNVHYVHYSKKFCVHPRAPVYLALSEQTFFNNLHHTQQTATIPQWHLKTPMWKTSILEWIFTGKDLKLGGRVPAEISCFHWKHPLYCDFRYTAAELKLNQPRCQRKIIEWDDIVIGGRLILEK